jgi:hypothetical protein
VRILVALALVLAACGKDHGSTPPSVDATPIAPPDADQNFCDASASSSHVSILIDGVPTAFTSIHAGGTISGGAVAPVTTTPMSLRLLFIDQTHLGVNEGYECTAPGQGCPYDGIIGRVDCVGCNDDALGPHPIMLQSLSHPVTVQGTLTITDFVPPFSPGPGHITGSISSPGAVVTGTFENDFCVYLIDETI